MLRKLVLAFLPLVATVVLSGCAGPIESWIVRTRDNQGDRALAAGNIKDAALAYRLALDVDPSDAHARSGAISVQLHPEFAPDYATALLEARRGTRFAESIADAAIESLTHPDDRSRVADWIARFLET